MQITQIETLCLSRPHEPENQWFTAAYRAVKADCAIVVIHTDAGLTGIGEACAYGVPPLIRDWVRWLGRALVGRDPADPMLAPHPTGRQPGETLPMPAHDCAAAGIDAALWDLRGQIAGQPVRALLAPLQGQPKARLRLYASSGCRYAWNERPEQLLEETLGYQAQGFTACKVRIGTEWRWDGVTTGRFLALLRDLRAAVGKGMDLMLDGNKRLSVEQSVEIAAELDKLGFVWFEEPFPLAEIDDYARLAAAAELPITGGEQLTTLEEFQPYLEKRALDIVQPDAGCCGLSEGLRIARMAESYGVELCPHNWHQGLMTMANAQLVAAIPNTRLLELCMIQGPLQWAILAEPPAIREGYLELPDGPGLGVRLAEDLEARFPYLEGDYGVTVAR